MTVQAVSAADAEVLFAVIRNDDFGWSVGAVPALMRELGWNLSEEISGKGAVADTPWGVPDTEAGLLYHGDIVESIDIRVTGRATTAVEDGAAVADAFVALTAVATRLLGPATRHISEDVPRTLWRLANATTTLQHVATGVLIVWCRNEYQDFNDSIGRY